MQALHLSEADYNFARRSLTMSRSHHVRGTASRSFCRSRSCKANTPGKYVAPLIDHSSVDRERLDTQKLY